MATWLSMPTSAPQSVESDLSAARLRDRILAVARWQKINLFHMGIMLHVVVGITLSPDTPWGFGMVKMYMLEYAGMAVLSCICLMRAGIHMGRPLLWTLDGLLQFAFPFVTPLILLTGHIGMSHFLKSHGVAVGWLGADLAQLKKHLA